MPLTLNDIDLPPNIEVKLHRAYGTKYSLQKFIELDSEELTRPGLLTKIDADMAVQCVSNAFYPILRRQTSVWQMTEIERDSIQMFSTGCPIIDKTLGGGIRLGQITELYGESGCGKTQLCIQMSLEVQRTFRARNQEAKVVYINTESQVEKIDKRLRHISYYRAKTDKPFNIADARCLQQKFFDNIYLDIIRHYRHLEMTLVDRLPILLNREANIRLIIIDSLAALFRSEDIMFEHHTKANILQYFGFAMHTLCQRYNLAIVCVNQVQTQFNQCCSILSPALGLTWAFLVHCRIQLTKTEQTEEHHPDSQQSQVVYDEQQSLTSIKTNVVYLRSLSIDYCYHIPKTNRCNYFIVAQGVFDVMGITKEELHTLFKGLNEYSSNNLSKLHPIADDLIGHIERSHDLRKLFGVILKEAIQDEIQSISSNQQIHGDDIHRQMILYSLDLLCRYLLVLEHFISHNDQSNQKKVKRSIQTCPTDWCNNERDEILYLFTNLIKLDLRQFWHETERLEDQQIGSTIVDVCLTIIRNNQYSSRTRTVKDYLSFILAIAIGLFRIEEDTSMKMIQMLQIQEHTATILSAVIVCHVKHFRTDTLLERIINDICHLCLSPLLVNNPTETNNSRTMAKLLDELSIHISDHLIIFINRLLDLFDSDCLQMRNCLLNVCVNIIRYCSSLPEYKELRGELFLLIIDQYFLDYNVHVRSHALGLCLNLVEAKLIPIKFYCHLTQATIERMNDTSCIVRKHAIQLATKLLKFNPYTDRFLPIDVMLDEYNTEMNKLVQLQRLLGGTLHIENISVGGEKIGENENVNDLDNQHLLFERIVEQQQRVCSMYSTDESLESFEKYNFQMSILIQLQSKLNHCLPNNSDIELVDDEEPKEKATRLFDNMIKQSKLVSYLHNATDFCNHLRRFLAKDAFYLLSSKVTSDVLEIIEFLVLWSSFEYQSKVYKKLEKYMFSLIWSHDKNISNAVINAFKRICLKIDEETSSEEISSRGIIEKLLDQIDLNLTLTFEHILKQLLGESNSTITTSFFAFIETLIDYYLKLTIGHSKKDLSEDFFKQIQQRQIAFLQLISFVIPYDKKHRLSSHFNSIIQNLQRRIDKDHLNYLCHQFQILSNLLISKPSLDVPNEFYEAIKKKLVQSSSEGDHDAWIECVKQFATLLFHQEPEQISANEFFMKFLRLLAELINWSMENVNHLSKLSDQFWRKIFLRYLASINALLTHRMKKYDHLPTLKKSPREKVQLHENDHQKVSRRLFEDEEEEEGKVHDDDENIQQDFNPLQQNSDFEQLEQELLQPNSLFSSIEKWLELFIHEDHSVHDENLVLISVSTCTRMMYISPILCSKYVSRIFELSKNCIYSSVRSALIVSLGDLLLRHPNIIEPFTPEFYAQIHDRDLNVGETALCTIAILILREMIKVRGYISEIALCLFHSHTPISSIAQHFFDELSLRQRGLALFNVLPDIISRLSMNNICSIDLFQQIIAYLFSFIKNDRHCEILVKRLCRQFKQACGDDRKRGNIAYCLSKLNIKTLPSYRILKENFPNISENKQENEDDYDKEEHLAWKKYLMPVLNDIERRLKPTELNSPRRLSSSTTPKRKHDRLA